MLQTIKEATFCYLPASWAISSALITVSSSTLWSQPKTLQTANVAFGAIPIKFYLFILRYTHKHILKGLSTFDTS